MPDSPSWLPLWSLSEAQIDESGNGEPGRVPTRLRIGVRTMCGPMREMLDNETHTIRFETRLGGTRDPTARLRLADPATRLRFTSEHRQARMACCCDSARSALQHRLDGLPGVGRHLVVVFPPFLSMTCPGRGERHTAPSRRGFLLNVYGT